MKKYDFITKEFLIKKYIKSEKSVRQITKDTKCSKSPIRDRLKNYNIKIRNTIIINRTKYDKILTKEFLIQQYIKNIKSVYQVAEKIGCSITPIYERLRKFDIKIRTISEAKKLSTPKGRNHPMFGKITHGKWSKYKGTWMRSSWEVLFAQFLDLSGIKYQYEPKTFDLGNTTYTPDFYLPEFNLYIEIKGFWRDDAKRKFKMFKQIYSKIKIKVLMQKNLKEIGVL